jgi:hypothetical protein
VAYEKWMVVMRLKLVLLIIIIYSLFGGISSWPIPWLLSKLENEPPNFFDTTVLSLQNAKINSPYTLKTKDALISFLGSDKMGLKLSQNKKSYIEIQDIESIVQEKGWTFASWLLVNKTNRPGLANIFWAGSTDNNKAPYFSLFFNSNGSQLHFSTIFGAINSQYNSIKDKHFHLIVLQLDHDLQTMTLSLDGREHIIKNTNIIYKNSNLFYIGRGGVPEYSISGGIADINIWNRPLSSQELKYLYEYYRNLNNRIVPIYALIEKILLMTGWICLTVLIILLLRDQARITLFTIKRFYTGPREQLLVLAHEQEVDVNNKTNFEIKQDLLIKIKPNIEVNCLSESQLDIILNEQLVNKRNDS